MPDERTPDNPLGGFTLTPERIRFLTEEELAEKRLAAETARAERYRWIYAMLASSATAHADGTLDVSVGEPTR